MSLKRKLLFLAVLPPVLLLTGCVPSGDKEKVQTACLDSKPSTVHQTESEILQTDELEAPKEPLTDKKNAAELQNTYDNSGLESEALFPSQEGVKNVQENKPVKAISEVLSECHDQKSTIEASKQEEKDSLLQDDFLHISLESELSSIPQEGVENVQENNSIKETSEVLSECYDQENTREASNQEEKDSLLQDDFLHISLESELSSIPQLEIENFPPNEYIKFIQDAWESPYQEFMDQESIEERDCHLKVLWLPKYHYYSSLANAIAHLSQSELRSLSQKYMESSLQELADNLNILMSRGYHSPADLKEGEAAILMDRSTDIIMKWYNFPFLLNLTNYINADDLVNRQKESLFIFNPFYTTEEKLDILKLSMVEFINSENYKENVKKNSQRLLEEIEAQFNDFLSFSFNSSPNTSFQQARTATQGSMDANSLAMENGYGDKLQLDFPLFINLKGTYGTDKNTQNNILGTVAYRMGATLVGAIQSYKDTGKSHHMESSLMLSQSFGSLYLEGQLGSISANQVQQQDWAGQRAQLTLGYDTAYVIPFVQFNHRTLKTKQDTTVQENGLYVGGEVNISEYKTAEYTLNTQLIAKVGYQSVNHNISMFGHSIDLTPQRGLTGSVDYTLGIKGSKGLGMNGNISVTPSHTIMSFNVSLEQ